jgi:predicted RNA polymerase sigma factor
MVSSLTHILGFENLQLAEDAVQDALLKAMRNWPFSKRGSKNASTVGGLNLVS